MDNILVRLLTEKDAGQVDTMDSLSGFYVGQWLEDNSDYAYGAFINGELAGYCTVGGADDVSITIMDDSNYSPESLLLSDVFVKAKYRHDGLATKMLKETCRQRVTDETLYCEPIHPSLYDLYKRIGFKKIDDYTLVKVPA